MKLENSNIKGQNYKHILVMFAPTQQQSNDVMSNQEKKLEIYKKQIQWIADFPKSYLSCPEFDPQTR